MLTDATRDPALHRCGCSIVRDPNEESVKANLSANSHSIPDVEGSKDFEENTPSRFQKMHAGGFIDFELTCRGTTCISKKPIH